MRHILAPAFLFTFRFLLPLVTCSPPPVWLHSNEVVHLYTANDRSSFHLQIMPDGSVTRTEFPSIYSAVVRKTIPGGYINIFGAKTRYFLCMRSNGDLYGSRIFNDADCVYKSIWLENHLEVYESVKHKLLVSLGSHKGPYIANHKLPAFSQFLPRQNAYDLKEFS